MNYTIKRAESVVLIDENGREINAIRIGNGRYCTAYRNGENVYLLAKPNDVGKQILGDLTHCDGTESPHIPSCHMMGWVGERKPYRTPYSSTLKASNTIAWQQFRILESEMERARDFATTGSPHDVHEGYTASWHLIGAVEGQIPESLLDALKMLAEAAANYGSCVWFEFAKRNLGVSEDGELVLRDVMFDMEEIQKERIRLQRTA